MPLVELANAAEFAVRAVDVHFQAQPEHMVWYVELSIVMRYFSLNTDVLRKEHDGECVSRIQVLPEIDCQAMRGPLCRA